MRKARAMGKGDDIEFFESEEDAAESLQPAQGQTLPIGPSHVTA